MSVSQRLQSKLMIFHNGPGWNDSAINCRYISKAQVPRYLYRPALGRGSVRLSESNRKKRMEHGRSRQTRAEDRRFLLQRPGRDIIHSTGI